LGARGEHAHDLAFEDLAAGSFGKFVEELDDPRDLIGGEILPAEPLDLICAEVGTWSAGDDSGHLLTILLIRSAYDADLIDLGDLIDDLFDLARVDVVSAMDDEVLDAVDDEEIPVLVQSTEVARGTSPRHRGPRRWLRVSSSSR